ncbi:CpsD/CapB family tyrosine-protein kinase [Latilactobacillus curvatus]|uniref:CpsD/CapB family tyrosine-protein kinase n=1 Tax=Latilactobacillus curvatus TaxID=28038 RepID=UPI0020A607E3|nr:CpsD/CapB family tyrosine-protein kinase [Latilactobacillus curvatus]MCT3531831.1 polysaccharide biosynthesis tyrosine autokinase [Latilactobacillus curvatus]UTC13962.1 exopolysaccharide biosynthesis protein [Latilactobacillus curvatus]
MGLFKKEKSLDQASMKEGVGLITLTEPTSVIAEQFRTVRTNIQFSSIDQKLRSVVFTSAGPLQGKSTVSANVAVTWADQGVDVLLVDADMRRPTVHQTFQVPNKRGLTSLLTDETFDLTNTIQKTPVDHLFVLPCGVVPPNPSELLNTKKMDKLIQELTKHFDLVIFDVPPVISVTDAQILASKVDGTILVVPQGIVEKGSVAKTKELLEVVNARILGTIMNRVKAENMGGYYGGYYGAEEIK